MKKYRIWRLNDKKQWEKTSYCSTSKKTIRKIELALSKSKYMKVYGGEDLEDMDMENILNKAIETYGVENQLSIAQEEMAECIQAISKYKRNFKDGRKRIVEEITDVEIMISQIKIMLDLKEKELEEEKLYKLERLEATIERMKIKK